MGSSCILGVVDQAAAAAAAITLSLVCVCVWLCCKKTMPKIVFFCVIIIFYFFLPQIFQKLYIHHISTKFDGFLWRKKNPFIFAVMQEDFFVKLVSYSLVS